MEVKVENSYASCSQDALKSYVKMYANTFNYGLKKMRSYYVPSVLKAIMKDHLSFATYGIYSYHYDDYTGCGHQLHFYLQIPDNTFACLKGNVALGCLGYNFIGKPDEVIQGKDGHYYIAWYLH